jgi:putative hydrolase of the HAD superfamily
MNTNSTGIERIRSLSRPAVPIESDVSADLGVLEGIRAVIFDVYGTLFVSGSGDVGTSMEVSSAAPFSEALGGAGLIPPEWAESRREIGEILRDLYFDTIRKHHNRLRERGNEFPEVDIREVWSESMETLSRKYPLGSGKPTPDLIEALAVEVECRLNPVWPMPEIIGVLEYLRSRGFVLGIVSNAQFYTPLLFPALTGGDLSSLGFSEDLLVWSYLLKTAKPSSLLFLEITRELRNEYAIAPREAVYIGNDMLNDVFAAGNVGLRTVLFAGDARSLRMRPDDPRCKGVHPDSTIKGLEQLKVLL